MLSLFFLLAQLSWLWRAWFRPCRLPSARLAYRRVAAAPPPRHYRRKPDWVVREVIRLKALTGLSCHQLAATFNRLYAAERQMTVGKTWVAETIKRHHYAIAELRQRWKRQQARPQPRNVLWGLDLTGKGDEAGQLHPILGIIDHGSRLTLCLQPLPTKRAVTVLKALLYAVETFGLPRCIQTDNEAIFHSRLFRLGLALLGIRQRFSEPGMPWQNGRVERLFGTLKSKLDQLVVADFAGLQQAIAEFAFWYNAIRPHQHLQGRTPLEAWQGVDPYRQPPRVAYLFEAWDGLLAGVYLRR